VTALARAVERHRIATGNRLIHCSEQVTTSSDQIVLAQTAHTFSVIFRWFYQLEIRQINIKTSMSTPFPKPIQKLNSKIFHISPEPVQHTIGVSHRQLIRQYCKLKTWYRCGRHYKAPVDPFKIYHIDPEMVSGTPINKPSGSTFISDVRGGKWDLNTESFKTHPRYKSFEARFKYDASWKETEWYTWAIEKIEAGNSWKGYDTVAGVEERFQAIDDLYQSILSNGVEPNKRLRSSPNHISDLQKHESIYWHSDEITVDVGRDGQFLFYKGRTRLSLSQIAGVHSVPVRIRIRHKKWQQHRETIIRDKSKQHTEHPDLINIR